MKRMSIGMTLLSGTLLIAASACHDNHGSLFGAPAAGRSSSPAAGVVATATAGSAKPGAQTAASPAATGGSTSAIASWSAAGQSAVIDPCRLVTADESNWARAP